MESDDRKNNTKSDSHADRDVDAITNGGSSEVGDVDAERSPPDGVAD
tara:strand:+ start:103 stop:243 length:141 start_codon:yes stop_codon:yes gene_type:complete